jgi:hypothetical protein
VTGRRVIVESKQGNVAARKMLAEAAWSAKTAPGAFRAFFVRVQKARWAPAADREKTCSYGLARPDWPDRVRICDQRSRDEASQAALALREYGKAGPGRDYWIEEIRHARWITWREQKELTSQMVAAWKEKPPHCSRTNTAGG